jgi:hypothetical protein
MTGDHFSRKNTGYPIFILNALIDFSCSLAHLYVATAWRGDCHFTL